MPSGGRQAQLGHVTALPVVSQADLPVYRSSHLYEGASCMGCQIPLALPHQGPAGYIGNI